MHSHQARNLLLRNKHAAPVLPKVQCRRMPVTVDNVRSVVNTDTGRVTVSGYAVKWDSINYYGEKFVKGAFADVCAQFAAGQKPVHAYYNHGWRHWFVDAALAMRVGKWLELAEDDTGLYVKLELTPGLPIADAVAAMVQHGTVDGFSIAFYEPQSQNVIDKGAYVEIVKADIYEISVVDEPADDAARVIDDDAIAEIQTEDDALAMMRSILPNGYADKLLARLAEVQKPAEKKPDPFAWLDSHTV